jgi:prepilin-type N-terminal cleavage/methylation domain-containing protein
VVSVLGCSPVTLIEILIVIAIIGIVAALGASLLNTETGRVREDQAAIVSLIERSKSLTVRYNASTTIKALDSKTMRAQGTTLAGVVVWETTLQLNHTTFYPDPASNKLVFRAPYARTQNGSVHLEIRSSRYRADIDAIGVTGKIIVRPLLPLF